MSMAPSTLAGPPEPPCSARACWAQPSRLIPASTFAHDAVAQHTRMIRYNSTGTSSRAYSRSAVVRFGTRQASLRFSSTAIAGGMAHSQFHTYWCTISEAVSRKTKPILVMPFDSRLSCWRHSVAVHLFTVERTRSLAMPSSHLRRWAHSERSVIIGPA